MIGPTKEQKQCVWVKKRSFILSNNVQIVWGKRNRAAYDAVLVVATFPEANRDICCIDSESESGRSVKDGEIVSPISPIGRSHTRVV